MISSEHEFIYVHYPKTGGNTIQLVLLPFSDDKKYTERHQDGSDRFEVSGPNTPEKHASLQDYAGRLNDLFPSFRVVISVRHPFERFVSAYFSPHKWLRKTEDGEWVAEDPHWDETRMESLLKIRYQRPATEYLTVDGRIVDPDYIIRYERFSDDLMKVTKTLGLPMNSDLRIPHVNKSAASSALKKKILDSADLRRRIEDFYRSDMDYFGYESYQRRR